MKRIGTIIILTLSISVFALPRNSRRSISTSTVSNSTISNENRDSKVTGKSNSKINTGVKSSSTDISRSEISNSFEGKVDARGSSEVDAGVKFSGAEIKDSELANEINARIDARNASLVQSGIKLQGASKANVKTKLNADRITASNGEVKAGAVTGSMKKIDVSTDVNLNKVNASNLEYKIATVKVNTGKKSGYKERHSNSRHFKSKNDKIHIGNVTVNSKLVKNVDSTVDGSDLGKRLETKHKARVYAETNGVDPNGTKHVFVCKKQRRKAEREKSAVGNTVVEGNEEETIRGVNTYVE